MFEVNVTARSVKPYVELLGPEPVAAIERLAESVRGVLGSRAVWNISSTASGGGVAEMLRPLLRYARGLGVQVRWAVIEGPPEFFRITKRVHNALHDSAGDGSPLGPEQAALYDRVTLDNRVALEALLQKGDVVICHDPQTAGLVPALVRQGYPVIWRCHIGHDRPGDEVARGWEFLHPYLADVPYAVFSRAAYAPPWLPGKRSVVLPPNIDPFSPKNQTMGDDAIRAILTHVGLVEGPQGPGAPEFVRDDGSVGRVDRKAEVIRLGRAPQWETPLVVQVSRWDRIKDPLGVMAAFVRLMAREPPPAGAQLVLAGPNVASVADDPEGAEVLREVEQAWRAAPEALRGCVHLTQLPMQDLEENAAIVNALQRHAAVIVQKSLHEGFGLTVTEAMWKRRPVIASSVGGIQDQIRDGIDGLLLRTPTDPDELADCLRCVLTDPQMAVRLGDSAYGRVREHYLSLTALEHWAELLQVLFTS